MINYHNNESVLNARANFYGQTILGKYNTVNLILKENLSQNAHYINVDN